MFPITIVFVLKLGTVVKCSTGVPDGVNGRKRFNKSTIALFNETVF